MEIKTIINTNNLPYWSTSVSAVTFKRSQKNYTEAQFISAATDFFNSSATHETAYIQIGSSRWSSINQRCGKYTSNTSAQFKSYRNKNIQIKMTRDEFMEWWKSQKQNFYQLLSQGEKPSIDRIDSNGHYEVSNLQLTSLHENIEKRWGRACNRATEAQKKYAKVHNQKSYLRHQAGN